jgi:G3E family GTPase
VITVGLLTGFLGSGKTSLLRRLLALPDLSDTAVLINELGEVGIDHLLLERIDDEVLLLSSGCVCCTIRGDLKDAMVGLHDRMRNGLIPPFARLVIETTGLADPAPIVATLSADPVLCHHFRLGNVVTVVDAVEGAHNLDSYDEARKQVAVADRIVVSKVDLVGRATIDSLRARLHAINPTAPILESDEAAAAPGSLLLEDVHDERSRAAEVRRWLEAEPHGHHAADIRTLCLSADRPLDWAAFGLWLSMLLNRHGSAVLRVKGLLEIEGAEAPVVIHGVQHTIHPPVHLDRWPDGRRTRLVLIVRDLDPAAIERSFRAFLGLGEGSAYAGRTSSRVRSV